MNIDCGGCGKTYDDFERTTLCPHGLIMPREDLDRKIAALKLYGKGTVRFVDDRRGPDYRVQWISWNGMIGLEGLEGDFAPHLLVAGNPSS